MRQFFLKTTLFLFAFTLSNCEKKDTPTLTPLEQLPKATKIGANTAGCLVNGEAFLPKGHFSTGNLNCFYINQKNFSLGISKRLNNTSSHIYIYIYNTNLHVNRTYFLTEDTLSDSKYGEFQAPYSVSYKTTSKITGELTITHHDYNNAIISGTFWFDAVNNIGEKVEVREGRFDMKY
ncbi:DUF6252 family protein [Polaribacter cellanae]|uniref:Uncharacterized protein n=1 Tax=Polaribacter cellanae TaxID=2818493 RepID=A0A975H5G8_9FLAO|nr:DUF6252 family protein [Polaribacter cellanae]QTE21377.1 hypothetical protein J3359_11120 [Polaribacter cellanae]